MPCIDSFIGCWVGWFVGLAASAQVMLASSKETERGFSEDKNWIWIRGLIRGSFCHSCVVMKRYCLALE